MISKMKKIIRSIISKNPITSQKAIAYEGLNLPPFRSNQALTSNQDYLDSGVEQLDFLQEHGLLREDTVFLDFGCGQGRIVNTLEHTKTKVGAYVGIDTDGKSIAWDQQFLSYRDSYTFLHLPAFNARYNDAVEGLKEIPFDEGHFDLIFLNSVFSHMLTTDIVFYLKQFHRVLKPGGFVYATAFIEEDVPNEAENPRNYLSKSAGALHRVRFEKGYFFELVDEAGFRVKGFHHQQIPRTQQSVVVLARK